MWERRGSDSHPIISQTTYGGRRAKQQLKLQLLLVHFYFVSEQFQIRIYHFSLVCPTYVLFSTQIEVLFLQTLFSSQFLSHINNSSHMLSSSLSTYFRVTNNRLTSNIDKSFNICRTKS